MLDLGESRWEDEDLDVGRERWAMRFPLYVDLEDAL
jgi:hypothetical protein